MTVHTDHKVLENCFKNIVDCYFFSCLCDDERGSGWKKKPKIYEHRNLNFAQRIYETAKFPFVLRNEFFFSGFFFVVNRRLWA